MESVQTQTNEIDGVSHPTVLSYFETLNTGEFDATSELFAIDGVMQPPFEKPITGRDAIADYLHREAIGITAQPSQGTYQTIETGEVEFEIVGRVQTPVFSVNVTWRMILNADDEVSFIRIKLNASPKELMNLRR